MISAINSKFNIILASQSPRRRQLLSDIGIDYQIRLKSGIQENYPHDMPTSEVATYLSHKKFDAYKDEIEPRDLVITADTIVVLNDEIIGKPTNKIDAIAMLQKLSGNEHTVITGVTIGTLQKCISFDAQTTVKFSKLKDEEISHYIEQYRPFDKAGSYGIQEWIGYIGVEYINGSFYNVMGLPIQQLYHQLLNF